MPGIAAIDVKMKKGIQLNVSTKYPPGEERKVLPSDAKADKRAYCVAV